MAIALNPATYTILSTWPDISLRYALGEGIDPFLDFNAEFREQLHTTHLVLRV